MGLLSRTFQQFRFFCLLSALLAFPLGAHADLSVVRDGAARAVIVTAARPSAGAGHAAQELQHFIELMSGAQLPIQTDAVPLPADRTLLLVGHSRFTEGMKLPEGTDRDFSREGFVLQTHGNRLTLAGNEDGDYHGTEYAVYDLLERLGCRWYFPGDFGQVVPHLKNIEIPDLDVTRHPSFAVRHISISGWADRTGEMDTWLLRNKGTLRGGFAFPGDGSIGELAPMSKYAAQFPEIYAMNKDGKRQDASTPPQNVMLCMSSPKAVEIAANTICDYFRAHPEANSYAFSAPDNAAICYDPLCQARMHGFSLDSDIGASISDPYFNFFNNIAWAVHKQFPDKYVITLAYASRVAPPEGMEQPWAPNAIMQIAQLRVSALHPIGTPTDFSALRQQRILMGWAHMLPRLIIYDYDPHADLSRMPYWRSRAIVTDMRLYKQNHVWGFTTEGQNTFFRTGLNYYIRARCMWDVNSNPDALLTDFYQRFFGPAAAPMQKFCDVIETMLQATPDHMTWEAFNLDWTSTYPPAKIAALGTYLDQAEKLADTPEVRGRLKMYRLLYSYMTTYSRVFTLEHEGKYREALTALDEIPPIIAAAQAIQPGLLPPDPGWVLDENHGFASLKLYLGILANRADGSVGELLGRASTTAQFREDPRNIGMFEGWQRDEGSAPTTSSPSAWQPLAWQPIDLTRDWGLNGHRDAQGYAYDGIGWYRLAMHLKKPTAGRAQLFVPLVFAEKSWIWVNGDLVCSPTTQAANPLTGPTPEQAVSLGDRGYTSLWVDIQDHIRPDAENVITFRLQGTLDRAQHRGLADVPFVWAPRK